MSLTWRKSTYSQDTGGACVEVAATEGVLIRDTTNRDGFTLSVSASAWLKFTNAVKLTTTRTIPRPVMV
jgi:hypothetical protein